MSGERCITAPGLRAAGLLALTLGLVAAAGITAFEYATGDAWDRARIENFQLPIGAKLASIGTLMPIVVEVVLRIPLRR